LISNILYGNSIEVNIGGFNRNLNIIYKERLRVLNCFLVLTYCMEALYETSGAFSFIFKKFDIGNMSEVANIVMMCSECWQAGSWR
jgi:hypothetical protein